MKVRVGLECSGRRRTWRPLLSRRYSEIGPAVFTAENPETFAADGGAVGGAASAAAAVMAARMEKQSRPWLIVKRAKAKGGLRLRAQVVQRQASFPRARE